MCSFKFYGHLMDFFRKDGSMRFNDDAFMALLATESGRAAYLAHSQIIDYQVSCVLAHYKPDAWCDYDDALAALAELNNLATKEGLKPVIEGDLTSAERKDVDRAIFDHIGRTLDADVYRRRP